MAKHTSGYLFKRGEKFVLEYTANGQRRRKTLDATNRRDAEAERDRLLAPIAAKDEVVRVKMVAADVASAEQTAAALVEAARPKLAITATWAAYVASKERPQSGPATMKDYGFHWSKFTSWLATQYPAVKALEDVTREHANAFAGYLEAEGLSGRRYNMIMQTLRRIFTVLASSCPGLGTNPFALIRPKAQRPAGRRDLAEGEFRAIIARAAGELRLLLAIGLYTGLRLGDACTLTWDKIDLVMDHLALIPSKTARTGRTVIIPLFPTLRSLLEETPPQDRRGYVLPETAAAYQRDRATVSHALQAHFRACGVKTQGETTGVLAQCLVGYHSFRHTFVSLAARAGVPMAVVMDIVGHGNPQVTRLYTHMGTTGARAAIRAMPDVLTVSPAPLALPPASSTAPAPKPATQVTLEAAVESLARIRAWATTARLSATARRELLALVGE